MRYAMASVIGLVLLAAQPSRADVALSFLIDGDTFTQPFSISNASTAGENVTRFIFDLTGTGFVFDPEDGGPPGNGTLGTPFTPLGGSAATTGLVGPVVVPDGSLVLDISFTDFNPGEVFSFELDVDPSDSSVSPTVLGSDLIGASVRVDFSNGLTTLGTLQAVPGNPDASIYTVTATVPTPSVPEPATLATASAGALLGLAYCIRRRKGR